MPNPWIEVCFCFHVVKRVFLLLLIVSNMSFSSVYLLWYICSGVRLYWSREYADNHILSYDIILSFLPGRCDDGRTNECIPAISSIYHFLFMLELDSSKQVTVALLRQSIVPIFLQTGWPAWMRYFFSTTSLFSLSSLILFFLLSLYFFRLLILLSFSFVYKLEIV